MTRWHTMKGAATQTYNRDKVSWRGALHIPVDAQSGNTSAGAPHQSRIPSQIPACLTRGQALQLQFQDATQLLGGRAGEA